VKQLRWTVLAVAAACGCREASTAPHVPPLALLPLALPTHVAVDATVAADSDGVAAVWLVLTNQSTRTDTVTYGACPAAALLYIDAAGQAAWQSAPPPGSAECAPDYLVLLVLPPSATRAIRAGRLAASGPIGQPAPGHYLAAAAYHDGTTLHLVWAGPVVCTLAGCAA
jgi:hypothetical protein